MDRGDRIGLTIERAIREGMLVARVDGSTHQPFPVAIPDTEGEALRSWVVGERARTTIEVGLGYAISTLFICHGLLSNGATDVGHVAIDPYQHTRFSDVGLQLLDEAGVVDVVEFHESGSETMLPKFLDGGRSFDLAFVDGNHRFDGVFLDLTYLGRLVKPGGVVFVDDHQLPAIERAVSFFVRNLGCRCSRCPSLTRSTSGSCCGRAMDPTSGTSITSSSSETSSRVPFVAGPLRYRCDLRFGHADAARGNAQA